MRRDRDHRSDARAIRGSQRRHSLEAIRDPRDRSALNSNRQETQMKHWRYTLLATATIATAAFGVACSSSDSISPRASGSGTMVVRLTDAPFLVDSLESVDIHVVRVDARRAAVDSAGADQGLSDDSASIGGWTTIASPDASINVLSLQNGITATIGQTDLPAGTYNGFRFIIDPSRSSVTLKNGQVLTGDSKPGIKFPSGDRSGIKVILSEPVDVVAGTTTTLLIDFNVNDSFVMRGNSIDKNGLLFKPVIRASVTNLGLTNATVRLVNASDSTLNLLENAAALAGGSDLAFGASSACSSVNALTPALTVTTAASSTPLVGFAPILSAGHSFSLVAYPITAGGVQFVTLANDFAPTTGMTGLRVFNATDGTTAYDVYVTEAGGALTTPTVANVTAGGTGSAFVSVPAGTQEVRVTTAGGTTAVIDLTAQTFTAGQNLTLVIAPPASGSTTPRAFLVAGC
jgi:hypothetical protein